MLCIKKTFLACEVKNHFSLCKQSNTITVASEGSIIYCVVTFRVTNITCRALPHIGVGSSNAFLALLEKRNIQKRNQMN